MFRITDLSTPDRVVLKLEGRCSADVVGELEAGWRAAAGDRRRGPVLIDICDVCQVDQAGRDQLARMHRAGARFVARGCLMRELIREIAESE